MGCGCNKSKAGRAMVDLPPAVKEKFPIGAVVWYRPGKGTYGYEDLLTPEGRAYGVVKAYTSKRVKVQLSSPRTRRRVVVAVDHESLELGTVPAAGGPPPPGFTPEGEFDRRLVGTSAYRRLEVEVRSKFDARVILGWLEVGRLPKAGEVATFRVGSLGINDSEQTIKLTATAFWSKHADGQDREGLAFPTDLKLEQLQKIRAFRGIAPMTLGERAALELEKQRQE